ncbi:hypothetical protein HY338_02800 [Candidatus Gottesmanbacteria bacterium]|nr:hypothetical protein [Candidatus Gottesmanbacteria bacterium]
MAFEQLTNVLSHVARLEVEPLEKAQERAQIDLEKERQFDNIVRNRLGDQHVAREIPVPPVIQKVEVVLFDRVHFPWFPRRSTLFTS